MTSLCVTVAVSPTADMQQCPQTLYDCSTLETSLTSVADVILMPDFVSSVHNDHLHVNEICRWGKGVMLFCVWSISLQRDITMWHCILCVIVYCLCVIVYCLCVIVVYSFQSGNREDDTQTLPCIIEHVFLVLTVVTVTIHTYIPRPTPADLSGYEVCYKKLYSNAAYHHLFQNGDNICNVKLYTTLNQTHIKEIYNIFTQYSVTSIKVL